jgi:hypothetical protein
MVDQAPLAAHQHYNFAEKSKQLAVGIVSES